MNPIVTVIFSILMIIFIAAAAACMVVNAINDYRNFKIQEEIRKDLLNDKFKKL